MARHSAITIENVTIIYGANKAVDDVSFAVASGEVHALIGPNGSGKSSLIHAIMGINPPKIGRVVVAGQSVYDKGVAIAALRRLFAVIPDDDDLIELLTGEEYVHFSAALYHIDKTTASARLKELCALFEMSHAIRDRVGSYSHGMRKKLAFMAAMVAKPDAYIIDEPTNGLDPDMILMVKEIIASLKKSGASILLATHNLDFAQAVADSVTMLRAKVLASGKVDRILKDTHTKALEDAYLKLSGHKKKHEAIEAYITH